jgi:hypothetical protein
MTLTNIASTPDWLPAEMPPGYRNRLEEIQRLSRDLEEMGRFGRLLCAVGPELRAIAGQAFTALEFDSAAGQSAASLIVSLDGRRRLLLHVSDSESSIRRRSGDLAEVFRLLHEEAHDDDRVVLLANPESAIRPADRGEAIEPEAVRFLTRLGANFLPASTVFGLWSMSLQDRRRARELVDSLHAQDGGLFRLPTSPQS